MVVSQEEDYCNYMYALKLSYILLTALALFHFMKQKK